MTNMTHYWNPSDTIALRWIANGRVWIAQPNIVVKDDPDETALLMLPGTLCRVPEMVWQADPHEQRDARWDQERNGTFTLREHVWHTNRLLMILESDAFYSVIYFWNDSTNAFTNYYVNFQLPFRRSAVGFDTYDLELDIVVEPSLAWHYKDEEHYHDGIACGGLRREWVDEIERAKPAIFAKLRDREYPFDGRWIDYRPDAGWATPTLPERWDEL